MIDVTFKTTTHRAAIATATVKLGRKETMDAVKNKTVPKGDVLEMAKTAGLFAVKRTSDMIPDCHPLPVEYTAVRYQLEEKAINIELEVHTIYKTGVEVEAMHGATVIALTIYDMLKPLDKEIEITGVRLKKKSGGKSDYANRFRKNLKAAVIVCSDSISEGKKEDRAGKAIMKKLGRHGVGIADYVVIPDEVEQIRSKVLSYCEAGCDLVILTGGTGLSPRDVTPEALRPLIHREVPGIMEAVRAYGQQRTPYSMLSRGIAGMKDQTLILALPGSTRGASESVDALFPGVLHVFGIVRGASHDQNVEKV